MDAIYILPKYWILRYCSNKLKLKDWSHNVNVIILPKLKWTKKRNSSSIECLSIP